MNLEKVEEIVKSVSINLKENDIFNILKNRKRWPYRYPWGQASIEIIAENEYLVSDLFFKSDGYFDFERWKKYYDLGFTSIISNVLDLNEDLRLLNKKLTEHTGLVINGNFYFSKPGRRASFSYHNHEYDVIAKQIYGEADWKIDEKIYHLKAGNTCIIPKNVYHQVLNKENDKLSLTINIQ